MVWPDFRLNDLYKRRILVKKDSNKYCKNWPKRPRYYIRKLALFSFFIIMSLPVAPLFPAENKMSYSCAFCSEVPYYLGQVYCDICSGISKCCTDCYLEKLILRCPHCRPEESEELTDCN